LIAPAIELAEKGITLEQGDVDILAMATDDFHKDAAAEQIFLNNGTPWAVRQTVIQKDLAGTLRLISDHGVDGFYKGPVADAIVASRDASTG
jgi:gamma-glutamyltranspeptidase/glutathione hydrolase